MQDFHSVPRNLEVRDQEIWKSEIAKSLNSEVTLKSHIAKEDLGALHFENHKAKLGCKLLTDFH